MISPETRTPAERTELGRIVLRGGREIVFVMIVVGERVSSLEISTCVPLSSDRPRPLTIPIAKLETLEEALVLLRDRESGGRKPPRADVQRVDPDAPRKPGQPRGRTTP